MQHRRRSTIIAITITLALVPGALSGCGTQRSAEAYCNTMQRNKDPYQQAMSDATDQMRNGDTSGVARDLPESISALGDIQKMWAELADVAPAEIRLDVESVRDTSATQLDNARQAAGDPIGELGSALIDALANSGPIQRVETYTREKCTG